MRSVLISVTSRSWSGQIEYSPRMTTMRVRWDTTRARGRDGTLFVRRVVEPIAPPVLLLHGLGVSGSVFQPFARRLLPGLAAVVPDLRGHGQSDAPTSGYTPADYAADMVELIHALPLETPVPVIGHSLGALVAMRLGAKRPELVRWLVLLDPPLDPSIRNTEVAEVFRLRSAAPGTLEAYLLERNPGGGDLLAQALAREFRQAADLPFEVLLGGPPSTPIAVQVPTLVLQADPQHGGVLGDAAAQNAVHVLGNAELRKITGATHALHASKAAEVAAAIAEFATH
jgi:pimeloyl-ACP methyl ester carboxylesterase